MKKFSFILLVVLSMVLCLSACEKNNGENSSNSSLSETSSSINASSSIMEVSFSSLSSSSNQEISSSSQENISSSQEVISSSQNVISSSQEIISSSSSSSNSEQVTQGVVFAVNSAYSGSSGALDSQNRMQYKTISEVITYLNGANLEDSVIKTVYLASGTYTEKLNFGANLKNVRLIGNGKENTKISFGDCASTKGSNGAELGTDGSATVTVLGDGFMARGIWFENSFNYLSSSVANKQALAILVNADKCIFEKCGFSGYQDTLEAVSGRQYYHECIIKGCVDFIFGNNAPALFENCEIVSVSRNSDNGGYITATKGNNGTNGEGVPKYSFVFKGCNFTAESGVKSGSVGLGRPWRADATVAFLNCQMAGHISKTDYTSQSGKVRYTYMNGGDDGNGGKLKNEPHNAHYYEYNNVGDGAISQSEYNSLASNSSVKLDFTMLTDSEASTYTTNKIFGRVNGALRFIDMFYADSLLNELNSL